jgi:hypothetical protein
MGNSILLVYMREVPPSLKHGSRTPTRPPPSHTQPPKRIKKKKKIPCIVLHAGYPLILNDSRTSLLVSEVFFWDLNRLSGNRSPYKSQLSVF